MKTKALIIASIMALAVSVTTAFASAIDDLNMGLSKTSVFDVPTPSTSAYPTIKPKKSESLLPRAYESLPPQITHLVDEYLPITMEENECLDCHDRRKLIGKTWKKGKNLPMPDSHYGRFGNQGGTEDVSGSRYNCGQCHVPMSDAKPLVENTFK